MEASLSALRFKGTLSLQGRPEIKLLRPPNAYFRRATAAGCTPIIVPRGITLRPCALGFEFFLTKGAAPEYFPKVTKAEDMAEFESKLSAFF